MISQEDKNYSWVSSNYESLISHITQTSLHETWSEYLIIRTILQELLGACYAIEWWDPELHGPRPDDLPLHDSTKVFEFKNGFETIYDSSCFMATQNGTAPQTTYNQVEMCQVADTFYVAISLGGSEHTTPRTFYLKA